MDAAHTAIQRGTFFSDGTVPRVTDKKTLRQEFAARLDGIHADARTGWGTALQERLIAHAEFRAAATVAVYSALPAEVPLALVVEQARAHGKRVCYPLTQPPDRVLSFHAIQEGAPLAVGRFGIREPLPSAPRVPLLEIDLFVVPGLGFTRQGARLGKGGGYYDATLAAARPAAVRCGVAFGVQIVDTLPTNGHDMTMDWIFTETDTFRGTPRP